MSLNAVQWASIALGAAVVAGVAGLWTGRLAGHGAPTRRAALLLGTAASISIGLAIGLAGISGPLALAALGVPLPEPLPSGLAVAAVVGVATALALLRVDPARRAAQLAGAALSAAVPFGLSAVSPGIDSRLALDPLPLALLAAVASAVRLGPARRAVRAQQVRSAALDATGDSVLVVDPEGRIVDANAAARRTLGVAIGPSGTASVIGRATAFAPASLRRILSEPEGRHVRLKSPSGHLFEAWTTDGASARGFGGLRAVVIRDVTGRHRDERKLLRLALYDSLTGLANRRLFIDHLAQAIQDAETSGRAVALLYVDLDHFKEINDSLGHGAGDELLRVVADRFRERLGTAEDSDSVRAGGPLLEVARLGGDEFAVVASPVPGAAVAEGVADRILQLIAEPIELAERTWTGSASVGIALFPQDGADVETLVKHADTALYAAKRKGRNRRELYRPSFATETERVRLLEQGLRDAIDRGELRLFYQPKIDLRSETVVGFEALLRWFSAELGPVGPREFIPVAESRGLIDRIGAWCLDEACRQIQTWRSLGLRAVPVSVNVSSAQFAGGDLRRIVSEALRAAEVEPDLLEIELTESLLLGDDDSTTPCLRDLRAIGVRVALDDFGTGYSALNYLNRFPLDVLKMDRGFVRDIENDASAAAIASAVVSMAHGLGLEVVAEGVDSAEQVACLREMGCDQVQGFIYSAAVPADEASCFLAREQGRPPSVRIQPPPPGSLPREEPAAAPAFDPSGPAEVAEPDATVAEALSIQGPPGSRALVLDDSEKSLGPVALRLTRLGFELHYASHADEAHLLISDQPGAIRALIVPPEIDLDDVAELRERIVRDSGDGTCSVLVIGEEPGLERRTQIREFGAASVLWSPFEDADLCFLLRSALAPPHERSRRSESRIPVNLMVSMRTGRRRAMGVMSSLSASGAFVEMSEPFEPGTMLRLELELDGKRLRTFARVLYQQAEDSGAGEARAIGFGMIFYEPDDETARTLREAVEERSQRFRP